MRSRYLPDNPLRLLTEGYGWLPDLRRQAGADTVRIRVPGLPALALCGPAAARYFYDDVHVRRRGALPGPVKHTLFGEGSVHGLDGEPHRVRKAMFLSLMTSAGIGSLVSRAGEAWQAAAGAWRERAAIGLFEEAGRVLTRAVCGWAGVPVGDADLPALAADLQAMVDGFGTLGPRHWRARRARQRREAWLTELVTARRATDNGRPVSALDVVARHRDTTGELLPAQVAAVELLNLLRPTVAVSWFVAFAGHALHRWPAHRRRLRTGDPAFARAFSHEIRRFYPFAPFVGGRAVTDLSWQGERLPAGGLVLLDIYGQNHHPELWPDPYRFHPDRFLDRPVGRFELIAQGGGDPLVGHRCPGEALADSLLQALAVRLARLDYRLPPQDLRIPLRRIPTRPNSGVQLELGPHHKVR